MKLVLATICFVCFFFVTMTMASTASVYFKTPINFSGTGCPTGSFNVTGENTPTLSLLFDSYDAAQGMGSASGLERSSCNFAVPLHVPEGYQVSQIFADWRGYSTGQTEFSREYFLPGGGEGIVKTTNPSGDYMIRDEGLIYESNSRCGQDITLRINSSVHALEDASYIAMDSLDIKNTLELHVEWKRCGNMFLQSVIPLLLQ